jgi:uncharacterized protein (DUF1697 family)
MSDRHIALLRGINVGGKNKLPMKDLVAMFTAAGCADVQSYIQSGNVVFGAKPALAARVPALVGAAIEARFHFRPPLVLRTAAELMQAARANPYLRAGVDEAWLHLAFLADRPTAAHVAGLDPGRSPPDAFTVRGRDVYLHLPNGVAKSKLTNAWFDSRLQTVSTIRNWRTVLELVAMVRA